MFRIPFCRTAIRHSGLLFIRNLSIAVSPVQLLVVTIHKYRKKNIFAGSSWERIKKGPLL
jgi:hypothetical protein